MRIHYLLVVVGLSILLGMTGCPAPRNKPLNTGDPVTLKALSGKWTQEMNGPEVEGGPSMRRILVVEYSADDLRAKLTTYREGLLGFKRKLCESDCAFTLSDSMLTTKGVYAGGTWSTGGITNKLHFNTITARFKMSIDGNTLTETRTEVTFEQDGKVIKQVTTPLSSTWRRCR